MCLAAIAIEQSARFPWVLASNRDEFFDRAAQTLDWWIPPDGDMPILAGRDLAAGGTWLGLTATGRLALVTNVREPGRALTVSPSRGELVPQWLQGRIDNLDRLARVPRNGFNLFTADLVARSGAGLNKGHWFSNRPQPVQLAVGAGVFGLSNAALDTPWPKVQTLKQRLTQALQDHDDERTLLDAAFAALADPLPAPDDQLPATGVPLERERQLSSAFIRIEPQPKPADAGDRAAKPSALSGVYGTRCSTVVLVEQQAAGRQVLVVERSFDAAGTVSLQREERFRLRQG